MNREMKYYTIRKYSTRSLKCGTYFPQQITLVECNKGTATIEINSHKIDITKGMNFLISSTSLVKILKASKDALCTIIQFTSKFIWDYSPFITNQVFDIVSTLRPDRYTPDDIRFGSLILKQIEMIRLTKDYSYKNVVIANLFTNYFLNIYESARKNVEMQRVNTNFSSRMDTLLAKFWQLCQDNHQREHKVEFYAESLNITSRYLHKISKNQFGITPKQVIDYCLLNSAKRLLLTTEKTSQQISIDLNFPDIATFTQFFKRKMGETPLQFKIKHH